MERVSSWTLFTIGGVRVKIHLTVLLLLFYIVLATVIQFPYAVSFAGFTREAVTGSPFNWGLLFAGAALISILLHELGYALAAWRRGHRVTSITLMCLGSTTQLDTLAREPREEFKMAIIGPTINVLLAVIMFTTWALTQDPNHRFFSFWMGQANLVLCVFNLLPAFPADGSRLLRAALVKRWGYFRGVKSAINVSHVLAWALGFIGVIQFNFLLILLALLIYSATKTERNFIRQQATQ